MDKKNLDKQKLKKRTDEIEFIFGSVLLAIMLFSASVNVIWRYALNHALTWPDEVCRYGLVWVSFISMAAAVTSGNHLYVDLITGITNKFPRFALALKTVASILWVAVAAFLGYWGIRSVLRVTEMTQTLGFSMKVVYASIPIGCTLLIIRVIQHLILDYIAAFKEKGGDEK